jgi:hypothetical protein
MPRGDPQGGTLALVEAFTKLVLRNKPQHVPVDAGCVSRRKWQDCESCFPGGLLGSSISSLAHGPAPLEVPVLPESPLATKRQSESVTLDQAIWSAGVGKMWARACRSITDSVSLVLTLPVSPALLATRVLVVPARGPVVPVFPVLPLVAHLAGFPQSVKPVRSKNRPAPCGLCRNS